MSILITRPSPYGRQLTNLLNSMGKTAWHLPLITFSPGEDLPFLNEQLKKLSNQDLLFIMSQTAIKHAHAYLIKSNVSWPQNTHYYAIGRTTAIQTHKLIKITSIMYPTKKETSEELLQLVTLNNEILQGKRALIISGDKGRKILKKTLQKQGMHVTTCKTYSRIPIRYNGKEKSEYMIKIGIDTIVITSQEILQYLYNLVPNNYKKTWLIKCKLIVISPRIAIHAKKLGWKNILITNTADNNNLINILLKT